MSPDIQDEAWWRVTEAEYEKQAFRGLGGQSRSRQREFWVAHVTAVFSTYLGQAEVR
jgi:hypothetical protein